MSYPELDAVAAENARVFDRVLPGYVEQKVAWATDGTSSGWLDCTGSLWCVFDDPNFRRVDLADEVRLDPALPYRLYWSLADVVMPSACESAWVAERIRDEAVRQLSTSGYKAQPETRTVDGESHLGVRFRAGVRMQLRRLTRR